MTIESIFTHIKDSYNICPLDKAHKSIGLIDEKPFYVSPTFSEYNNDSFPRIVLFSAPGATGKSALAKHIAYKYSSLYWNLADIHLGEKTFSGTVISALGATEYSTYINALLNSQTLLVVDAFDESEINSGENMVRSLIIDMDEILTDCTKPYAVFFSRTETAQGIGEFLKSNGIPYVHYEIGLFSEQQAKSFVKDYIISEKGNCTTVQESAITQFFNKIKAVMDKDEDYESFIGYAPVLQSIAITIISTENTMALLNSISNTRSVGIIREIKGTLKVSFSNVYNFHMLTPYKFSGVVETQDGFDSFAYSIKRIFSYFRQHKKDTLGKDWEKIDNHVVRNEGRKKTFEYLLDLGVIYREEHLYKVNKEKMKECGISWIIDTESARRLHSQFVEWNKNKQK